MSTFASEKRAPGICDRCGRRQPLKRLTDEYIAGKRRNVRVCSECWDVDHPQNWQGKVKVIEREGLRDPRSDGDELAAVRSMPAWNPVGNPATLMRAKVGMVRVTV